MSRVERSVARCTAAARQSSAWAGSVEIDLIDRNRNSRARLASRPASICASTESSVVMLASLSAETSEYAAHDGAADFIADFRRDRARHLLGDDFGSGHAPAPGAGSATAEEAAEHAPEGAENSAALPGRSGLPGGAAADALLQ